MCPPFLENTLCFNPIHSMRPSAAAAGDCKWLKVCMDLYLLPGLKVGCTVCRKTTHCQGQDHGRSTLPSSSTFCKIICNINDVCEFYRAVVCGRI